MRLIQQSDTALPTGDDVYAIVKKVWQSSIEIVEKLLSGESYRTSTAEPLLALAAWHLYPNMTILGPNPADVLQEDPLFRAGGILTIGMVADGSLSENGITWSLPLSHLRFYGKPITKTRSLGLDSERVYFDDLKYLILGAVTGNWFTKSGGFQRVVEFLDALINCLRPQNPQTSHINSSGTQLDKDEPYQLPEWLELLWQAASDIRGSQGELRNDRERLYKLGHRRGLKFLSSSGQQIPEAFGLANFHTFIGQFADNEQRIQKVRNLLPSLISNTSLLQDGFISYQSQDQPLVNTVAENHSDADEHLHSSHADSLSDLSSDNLEEFATIIPGSCPPGRHQRRIPSIHMQGSLDVATQQKLEASYHFVTWEVSYMISPHSGQVRRCSALSDATGEQCGLYIQEARNPRKVDVPSGSVRVEPISRKMEFPFSQLPPEILQKSSANWIKTIEAERSARIPESLNTLWQDTDFPINLISGFGSDGSVTYSKFLRPRPSRRAQSSRGLFSRPIVDSPDIEKPSGREKIKSYNANSSVIPFCLRLQDAADKGAISHKDMGCPRKYYIAGSPEAGPAQKYSLWAGDGRRFGVWLPVRLASEIQGVPLDEIVTSLEQHAVRESLMKQLKEFWDKDHRDHLDSLCAFASASALFKHLPGATIALSVMKQPLHEAKWWKFGSKLSGVGHALSCLALFETGSVDVNPMELQDVMAMSAGNSLFMAEYIFDDPGDSPKDRLLRRTIGNIGKPGVSFLLSAKGLDSLAPDYSTWKSVQYAAYDGKVEDNFAQTTLHLALTGDEQPLNIGQTGYRDKEVFLVEAVIRAYDKSRWVADLDLRLLPPFFSDLLKLGKCIHSEQERDDYSAFEPLTSIDSWDELLDLPPNNCIVRAKGNWLARQAIAAFALQQSKPVVMASGIVCWACIPNRPDVSSNLLIIS